jgi:GNAT superfamily N-acetyltransferase
MSRAGKGEPAPAAADRSRGVTASGGITVRPATPDRWSDVERLFGPRGATGGCWCMYWRRSRAELARCKGEQNRVALRNLVRGERAPGLLAYAGHEPVGWCAVAPREEYPVLERSRILARVDDRPVWSVVCLFVARGYRRRGISVELLRAAAEHVRRQGGTLVEGYPVEPRQGPVPDVFAWTGLASSFLQAGFREVARRSSTRPIMRLALRPRPKPVRGR